MPSSNEIEFVMGDDMTIRPAHRSAFDRMQHIKPGQHFFAQVRKPRNIKFHRKYFALIRATWDNLPEQMAPYFKSQEHIVDELKCQTGHTETRLRPDGSAYRVMKSISFAAMDELEFEDFYNRCLDVVLNLILVGMEKEEWEDMLRAYE